MMVMKGMNHKQDFLLWKSIFHNCLDLIICLCPCRVLTELSFLWVYFRGGIHFLRLNFNVLPLSIICWSFWSTRHPTPHHPRRVPVGLAAFNYHSSSTSGWSCICLSPHRSVEDLRLPLIWNICRKMALGRPHRGTHSDIPRVWKFSWLLARMSRLLWSHTPVEDAQWTCRSPARRGYFFSEFCFWLLGYVFWKNICNFVWVVFPFFPPPSLSFFSLLAWVDFEVITNWKYCLPPNMRTDLNDSSGLQHHVLRAGEPNGVTLIYSSFLILEFATSWKRELFQA